jgi:hypothetical protein
LDFFEIELVLEKKLDVEMDVFVLEKKLEIDLVEKKTCNFQLQHILQELDTEMARPQ